MEYSGKGKKVITICDVIPIEYTKTAHGLIDLIYQFYLDTKGKRAGNRSCEEKFNYY
jgi:hypothetical protein